MTGANAVFAARPELGRLVAEKLSEIDQPLSVVFIAADAVVTHRDELRLPRDYSVIEATTVEAAAVLCQGHPPDLVILDLGHSALEGLNMLRRLKTDPRLGNAPLVLFGAFDDLRAIRHGLQLGARDYLIRGETTPSLVARRVRSWLDDPARQALSRRSPRPAGAEAVGTAALPTARAGLAEVFGGALVGLVVVLLRETLLLVAGRGTKRA